MMNIEAKEIFDEITAIMPDQLTKEEIGFLRARRMYLRPEQVEAFKSVLEDTIEVSEDEKAEFDKGNKEAIIDSKKKKDSKSNSKKK